jgi:glyoxalase family protein
LRFQDPEGQQLELVDDDGRLQGIPWGESPVPSEMQIRGLYGVRITARGLNPTAKLLTETMGFREAATYLSEDGTSITVFEVGPGGPGAEVHIDVRPDARMGRPGIGGVHHVAYRTPNEEEQLAWRKKISQKVGQITDVIDRFYFHSVYFREPGGVLFEIATDGPGFTADETPEQLGKHLALPPFLEPHRQEIEENLRPIIPFKLASVR